MSLIYDFDIFEVIPGRGQADPKLAGFLTDIGFIPQGETATVALFRDPRTADALRRANPALRAYLLDSGFGLNTYDSGAPPGTYPARDEDARLDVIRRLTENAPTHSLPAPEDDSEADDTFRLAAFLNALSQAEPIHMPDVLGYHGGALPPVFDTEPLSEVGADAAASHPRRKFWQHRFFRLGAAATLVLGAVHLGSGPALTVLASL